MVRSWFHNDEAWNYPAWSISAEWFAYIFVFPMAFFLFKRIYSWLFVAVLVALFLTAQTFLSPALFPGRSGSIFFLFLAGSGLYRVHCLVKNPPAETIGMCGALLLLAYVCLYKIVPPLILYLAFALLIFGLSYERGLLARFLSTKMVVLGGLASYSLYMTHFLILRSYLFFTWDSVPQSLIVRFARLLVLIMALAGAAIFSYRYLEEPANRKLRSFVTNFRKPPSSGACTST